MSEAKLESSLKKTCFKKCKEYSYWWTFKASLDRQTFKITDCVNKCSDHMAPQKIKVDIPS